MIVYLLKNIIWNPSIIKYCLLLGISALICLVAYFLLQIVHKRKMLAFDKYIHIEQAVVSLLVAIWSFGVLCLPFALIVWSSFYFIYPRLAKKNRFVNYVLKTPQKSYNPIIMEKHFGAMSHRLLLKEIFQEKKIVKDIFNTSPKSSSPTRSYVPIRIYLSGVATLTVTGTI